MGMTLRKLGKKLDKARRKAMAASTFGMSDVAGDMLGGALNARTIARRIGGKRNLRGLGFRGPKKVVTPSEKNTGLPGTATAGESACLRVDPADGAVQKPYTLIGRIQLAASAQAINTDLGDFLDAASSDDVATDNVIPFGVTIERAVLFVGLNELIASPIANPAMLAGFYIRFLVNGIEEARWPIAKFNPVVSNNGLVTSGGGASVTQVPYQPVPFSIFFDPDKTYSLALYNTRAVTPAAVVDLTLVLEGYR